MGVSGRLSLSAVLVALTIAGCGGDGDSTASSPLASLEDPGPQSKVQRVSESAAICSAMNAALGPLVFGNEGGEDRVREIAVIYRRMAELLEAVEPPRDDTTGYAEFMAAAKRLKEEEGDLVRAAVRGQAKALVAAEGEASSALRSFRAASAVWGAPQCTEGPDPPIGSQAGA